jgi:hypothetical protein
MRSALIRSGPGYPALPLARQPAHQRAVHPGPLVLGAAPRKSPTPTTDRDRTVSRRSEPSSRTALMGEQPNPWDLRRTLVSERSRLCLQPVPRLPACYGVRRFTPSRGSERHPRREARSRYRWYGWFACTVSRSHVKHRDLPWRSDRLLGSVVTSTWSASDNCSRFATTYGWSASRRFRTVTWSFKRYEEPERLSRLIAPPRPSTVRICSSTCAWVDFCANWTTILTRIPARRSARFSISALIAPSPSRKPATYARSRSRTSVTFPRRCPRPSR